MVTFPVTSFAETGTLVPLIQAIAKKPSRAYVYSRCAALYGASLDHATRIGGPQTGDAREPYFEAIGFHLAVAHIEAGHDPTDLPIVHPDIRQTVNAVQERYDAIFAENYLAQGVGVTGMITDDLAFCRALKEATVE